MEIVKGIAVLNSLSLVYKAWLDENTTGYRYSADDLLQDAYAGSVTLSLDQKEWLRAFIKLWFESERG
jgi:hypothetical protein